MMAKRLHLLFWLTIAAAPIELLLILAAGFIRLGVSPWTAPPSYFLWVAIVVLFPAGAFAFLYFAAFFSRDNRFQLLCAGVAAIAIFFYNVVLVFGKTRLIFVTQSIWTIAFIAVAISGAIRLVRAFSKQRRQGA